MFFDSPGLHNRRIITMSISVIQSFNRLQLHVKLQTNTLIMISLHKLNLNCHFLTKVPHTF